MRTRVICLLAAFLSLVSSAPAIEIEVESVVINAVADVEVPAVEAGSLVELPASEGYRFAAGDILARIDDRDANLEVARAEIALEHVQEQAANDVRLRLARQALKLAELELKKAEDANRELERVVSLTQIEKLEIEVAKAHLEIELAMQDLAAASRAVAAAKNELLVAKRAVERRKIVAPIDGIVADVRRRKGEWLEPGATVVRLVNADRLRAEGFVPIEKLVGPIMNSPAKLVATLPGKKQATVLGTVKFVSNEVNPINHQVRVWAEFDNSDGRLSPGLAAKLTIQLPSEPRP